MIMDYKNYKKIKYGESINKYVDYYMDMIEKNKIRHCKEQYMLVKHIRNVFANEDLYVDEEKIESYFSFQKYFFELYPWEKFVFVLHNCVFKKDGRPRWDKLFLFVGRGAGKNGYLAFEDFCLVTHVNGIYAYDIDICANSESQAKTSFDDIYNVLEKNEKKMKKFFKWNKEEIINIATHSKIKFRTNNHKTKDGLRSGKVDFDEIHAYESYENLDVFTTGLGKKPHPRRTYASTNGYVRDGVLDRKIEKGLKILKGECNDGGEIVFICRIEDENDIHDSENWVKANPSIIYNDDLRVEIENEYNDYVEMPIENKGFIVKRMNFSKGDKEREVTSWDNLICASRDFNIKYSQDCVVGIDFAKVNDFISCFILFKDSSNNDFCGFHHSWVCKNSADFYRVKILKDKDSLIDKNLLTLVDDIEISPEYIIEWIESKKKFYNIKMVAIDNYRYGFLSHALKKIGFDKNNKNIKLVRPSDIMLNFNSIIHMFNKNLIAWGDDPLMRWYTNNAKVVPAVNDNFVFGKIEPRSRKTDGFMALVNAFCVSNVLDDSISIDNINFDIFNTIF